MLEGVRFVEFCATSGATALQKAVVTGVLATLSAVAVASDTKSVAYCDPPRGSDTATVLQVCGKPISTHYARGAFKYAEWVYRDSIVGFVNDQVSYVLDLRE